MICEKNFLAVFANEVLLKLCQNSKTIFFFNITGDIPQI